MQLVAAIVLLAAGAAAFQEWGAARFWAAFAYLGFGGVLGGGLLVFASEARELWTALV
ncbi:hypothetical protein [Streptomyces sp. NBC_00091]|uniref:hypothetical protein n=1 Tax=Streptomyces sp. NBC_00091 TaxID=2975648 RepID=UPI002256B9D5|nr:hypothetical protein [Streptomyces sp. NBC_00091]MCX5374919.1 hypothetical protein [Streptomyces sp. NBC_00091]MCX5380248.1 hypothetical protein [Streptomyces sp. NBC_00091]